MAEIISIHLMLRFIKITEVDSLLFNLFQYISCYGLSLPETTLSSLLQSFQYISCYGLSWMLVFVLAMWFLISIHLMLRFISLCTLHPGSLIGISIHLMLRFINGCYHYETELHFNTSHVTVYHAKTPNCRRR